MQLLIWWSTTRQSNEEAGDSLPGEGEDTLVSAVPQCVCLLLL